MRSVAPLAAEVLAGWAGGTAKTIALYPLDTLATLRELREPLRPTNLARYYRGCGLTLLGLAPYALIFHAAFFAADAALGPSATAQMAAGVLCSLAAALVGVPFECLKHRIQSQAPAFATPRLALASTLRLEGVRGLYTGFGATLARNAPYNALHFGLFRAASAAGAADAAAGALASALTALLTTPLDLVNTRLQTQAARPGASAYAGVTDAIATIAEEEGGAGALMQGALARVAQYGPASLIFFVCCEAVKRRLLAT